MHNYYNIGLRRSICACSARDLKVHGLKLGKRECVVHIAEKLS